MERSEPRLAAWQRSAIRENLARYRRAQEDYALLGKPVVTRSDGRRVFSLVSPPLDSPAARRRVRYLMEDNLSAAGAAASPERLGALPASRTPHVVTIAVTYRCQCRCEHCSAERYRDEVIEAGTALSLAELIDAARQSVELGATCVVLTGGEPLLLDGIYDLVASIDPSKAAATLFTNGECVDEGVARRLAEAGAHGVYVSIDDPDPATHDRNRGRPGLFAKATGALTALAAAGVPTGLSTYVTRERVETGGLEAMMDLARSLGVLEVFLFDVIPTGRLEGQFDCLLSEEHMRAVSTFRAEYARKPEFPRLIHQTLFSSLAYPCAAEGCPAATVQAHVRGNGDVSPCDFTPRSFGNLRERPLSEIWRDMTASPLYAKPSPRCRLSRREFWDRLAAEPQSGA